MIAGFLESRGVSVLQGDDMRNKRTNKQKGYTLLEYCAGAAIIAGILWVALNNLGGQLSGLLDAISQWATDRTGGIGN